MYNFCSGFLGTHNMPSTLNPLLKSPRSDLSSIYSTPSPATPTNTTITREVSKSPTKTSSTPSLIRIMDSPSKRPQALSITRAMEEAPTHACDYCGVMTVHQCSVSRPNSSKIGGCPLFSFYCCFGHQLLDSQNHQEKCDKEEVRNTLVDIARTIQDCWLTVRQNTWDHDVKNIRIDGSGTKGSVLCELGDGEKFVQGKVFHEFDEGLVEELETKYGIVRDAVLTAGTSEHAVACLYKLVEHLLQGMIQRFPNDGGNTD